MSSEVQLLQVWSSCSVLFDEAADELLFTFRHNTLRMHWCGYFCLFIKTAGVAESDTHKDCRLTYDPAPHYGALEHTKM